MDNKRKNLIYSVVLLSLLGIVWMSRSNGSEEIKQITVKGETMGTYYDIRYLDNNQRNFKKSIDSLLQVFNQSVNHYLPDSEISRFNKQDSLNFNLPYFPKMLKQSKQISKITNGAFDPTVGPLVNAWGFGPEEPIYPEQQTVDSLLQLVGFEHISFNESRAYKNNPAASVNLSAIAKGYGVDVVADFLENKGINNLKVEIGGEVVCRGVNADAKPWRIGVSKPDGSGEYVAVFPLSNQAMATSGNYLNYYVKDGKRYSHTINPKTGYPVEHNLLSATVFAKNCAEADAYATAFMVMGLEDSKKLLQSLEGIEAYFLYDDNGEIKTFRSPGVPKINQENV